MVVVYSLYFTALLIFIATVIRTLMFNAEDDDQRVLLSLQISDINREIETLKQAIADEWVTQPPPA